MIQPLGELIIYGSCIILTGWPGGPCGPGSPLNPFSPAIPTNPWSPFSPETHSILFLNAHYKRVLENCSRHYIIIFILIIVLLSISSFRWPVKGNWLGLKELSMENYSSEYKTKIQIYAILCMQTKTMKNDYHTEKNYT